MQEVCVWPAKNRGKGVEGGESGPKSEGQAQKVGERLPLRCKFLLEPLGGTPIHLPCILALDTLLWPMFHLSLAPILTVWTYLLRFEGISYPF